MKHFTFAEFTKSEAIIVSGCSNDPIVNNENDVLCHIELLVTKLLDPICDFVQEPIIILSGYRSEAINKAVGGSEKSLHRKGQAADIIIPSLDIPLLTDIFWEISTRFDYDQLIYHRKERYIHVSYICELLNRNEVFVR